MERIVFTWSPGEAACDWLLLDGNGNRQGPVARGASLDEAAAAAPGRELVWLAPGTEVISLAANLPVKGREKVLRALPYALEERLAADPEQLFFALPAQNRGPLTHAVAADVGWLRGALAELAERGLAPARVVPDYLALPLAPDSWTVLADAGILYARSAPDFGFALEAETGWAVLARQLASLPETERPQFVRYIRGREPHGSEPALEVLRADADAADEGLLGVVPAGLEARDQLTLLQGQFNPRRQWQSLVRPWWPAIGAAAAVVVLALASFVTGWVRDVGTASELHRQALVRFHQILPHQPVVDMRTQVQQRLQALSSGGTHSGFLPLLAALAQGVSGDVRIESVTFQAGTLDVQVHAKDVPTLEGLRSAIAEHSGQKTSIHSANQTKSGVEGALSIGGGNAQ